MKLLIRLVISAVALTVATWLVAGIQVNADNTGKKIGTLIGVAVIFGVINAFLKPVIKTLGCALYVLTLGLFALVVNALLLELTSWLAGKVKLPFHVTGFWAAFWGAIIVGIVSWILNMFVHDDKDGD
jgi:putative membrane protein